MLCLQHEGVDAAFNLAAEEYLLKTLKEPAFMVWRNPPAVIIGRNQNPYRETHIRELERLNIPVVRRISGGGAVYHDTGTINFTFLIPAPGAPRVDYQAPLGPIIRFLKAKGLKVKFDGGNSLTLKGKKISGNAQHIHKPMILHHGTLLYDTDLAQLAWALSPDTGARYQDRSVDSVRQPVANLRPVMERDSTPEEFATELITYIESTRRGQRRLFSGAELAAIEELAASKYRTWRWNFGHTPDYSFFNTLRGNHIRLEIELRVCQGRIRRFRLRGENQNRRFAQALDSRLTGCRHLRADLAAALGQVDWQLAPEGIDRSALAEALF